MLAFGSLIRGYCSPTGNKPLMFSGRLETAAPRRLAETSRFVEAVCLPGGLEPFGPGFQATLKVRLMHAQVRTWLMRDARWKAEHWGLPINQYDMAGTILLFSWILLAGLEKVGLRLPPTEVSDVLHQWRLVGHWMGVDNELLCADANEANTLWQCIEQTQALPDADSERLAKALIEGPERRVETEAQRKRLKHWSQFGYAFSRLLLSDVYADALGYPKTAWSNALPVVQRLVRLTAGAVKVIPGSERSMLQAGTAYWRKTVELGLQGAQNVFEVFRGIPERTDRP